MLHKAGLRNTILSNMGLKRSSFSAGPAEIASYKWVVKKKKAFGHLHQHTWKVSANQTVQEFKEESFIVSREELSLKKQNIGVQVSSKKHLAKKEKMEKATKKESHIADAIAKYQ